MRDAEGHGTGGGRAFLQTLPVKMTDYLGGRTVKSQFGTPAPPPRPTRPTAAFKCRPTNLQASLPLGCSKCIIIKIPPVAGLHCNFQVACDETPHLLLSLPRATDAAVFPVHRCGFILNCYMSKDERIFSRIKQMNCGESVARGAPVNYKNAARIKIKELGNEPNEVGKTAEPLPLFMYPLPFAAASRPLQVLSYWS